MSAGILMKFTPIFILPFLIISQKKIHLKYFIKIATYCFSFILVVYLLWGSSGFNIFLIDEHNVSKMFSIFRFIRGEFISLTFFGVEDLDFLSIPLVIVSLVTYFIFHVIKKLDSSISVFISFSLVLLFYKIGHHQFFISLFLLLIYVFLVHGINLIRDRFIMITSILFFTYLFIMTILYFFTGGYRAEFDLVREWMGLVSFILQFLMTISFICFNLKYSRENY